MASDGPPSSGGGALGKREGSTNSLGGGRRNSSWQALKREGSFIESSTAEERLVYNGDLDSLVQTFYLKLAEIAGRPSVIVIDMNQETQSFASAADYLRAFRRLTRLSPWPTACYIRTPGLKSLDVVVALTCDVVFSENLHLNVTKGEQEKDEIMRMARQHWRFFTGEAPEGEQWHLENLTMGTKVPPSKLLGDFLPHYWMAMRNMGMAAPIFQGVSQEVEVDQGSVTSVERLKGAFNYIFGPKVACLFAAWDALQSRPGASTEVAVIASQRVMKNEESAAAAQAEVDASVSCVQVSVEVASLTFTSDILFTSADYIAKQCAILTKKTIKNVEVLIKDGSFANSQSIFPPKVRNHVDVYKWHRRWEQFLTNLRTRHVVCTMAGQSVCPPLMELFFSADVRIWESSKTQVVWCRPPFTYTPGPEAMQGGLRKLPVAMLRRLLLDGISTAEAADWGVIKVRANTPSAPMPGMIKKKENRRRSAMNESEVEPGGCAAGDDLKTASGDESNPRVQNKSKINPRVLKSRKSGITTPGDLGSRSLPTRTWQWGGGQLRLPEAGFRPRCENGVCSMVGYGLGNPGEEHRHKQSKIANLMGVPKENKHYSVLTAAHIKTRYLAELDRDLADPASVDLVRLHEKHLHWAKKMLHDAITVALADADIDGTDIGHVSVVSSSGYLLPGLTAYIVQDSSLGIPQSVSRSDIVGMGCHAGLNSFKSAAAWCVANPGSYALACGCEVMSAQYVWGDVSRKSLNTIVCNSLFGDGSFACVLHATPADEEVPMPSYFDAPPHWWAALCDTEALPDMTYQVEKSEGKYRFDLSELAPYHVSQGLFTMMHLALYADIPVHYVDHMVTHTGGQTILDNVVTALGLEGRPEDTLPYTVGALRDYGNQSSCSIMFAFDKLVKSKKVKSGDMGMFVTMGPGAGLEMAVWTAGDRFPPGTQTVQSTVRTGDARPRKLPFGSLVAHGLPTHHEIPSGEPVWTGKNRTDDMDSGDDEDIEEAAEEAAPAEKGITKEAVPAEMNIAQIDAELLALSQKMKELYKKRVLLKQASEDEQ